MAISLAAETLGKPVQALEPLHIAYYRKGALMAAESLKGGAQGVQYVYMMHKASGTLEELSAVSNLQRVVRGDRYMTDHAGGEIRIESYDDFRARNAR